MNRRHLLRGAVTALMLTVAPSFGVKHERASSWRMRMVWKDRETLLNEKVPVHGKQIEVVNGHLWARPATIYLSPGEDSPKHFFPTVGLTVPPS